MNKLATKFAASTLVMGLTMVGCAQDRNSYGMASARATRSEQNAERLFAQAHQALERGDKAEALTLTERAVELSPRDSAYRMLLADLYLKNGRFQSAEATFADVIELNPNSPRAVLSLALAQIAQGRNAAALGQLGQLRGSVPDADIGLAYALAGQPEQAIEMLEPAARADGATGRIRQNLALSYALAGNWERARVIAAQDVSPAELGARLQQWAAMAQPAASWTQVAALLNVTPVEDPGQPVRLALTPPVAETVAFAAAEPAPEPVAMDIPVEIAAAEPVYEAPEPVYIAAAEPVYQAPEPVYQAPEPVYEAPVQVAGALPAWEPTAPAQSEPTEAEVRYAAAVQTLVRPEPAVIRASASTATAPKPVFERPRPARQPAARRASMFTGSSNFVVQLGAFSNAGNAERAWEQAERRYGIAGAEPLTTTIEMGGRTLHRLSVAGFANHADASRLCSSIKAQGGACFVRGNAGDAPVRWASRSNRSRTRGA